MQDSSEMKKKHVKYTVLAFLKGSLFNELADLLVFLEEVCIGKRMDN